MYATIIAKGVTDFANNCELLKYGLHWDTVTPRRGPQSGRCHRSYKKLLDYANMLNLYSVPKMILAIRSTSSTANV